MAELTLHGRSVGTVFDLLGQHEDDLTYSLGWGLAGSDALVRALLKEAYGEVEQGARGAIRLQEMERDAGRTDVEIETEHLHLVIEAKRGWTLPELRQLEQYARRLARDERAGHIAVVAECSPSWPPARALARPIAGIPVTYIPWARIGELVRETAQVIRNHAERRLLGELHRYLKGVMSVQDTSSNLVYVVSLGASPIAGTSGLSTIDVLRRYNLYFCPVGGMNPGGWPKEPPNYLGFRFGGRLQQISHVEGYEVKLAPWEAIPELRGKVAVPEHPQFVFELGPAIHPEHEVRTGKLYRAQRVSAALDLLLTCKTISEARDKTRERLVAAGQLERVLAQ